jgi:DMSO/TMAO reductase YedYZ molybdopterin-dependent catalytic subunit
VRVIGPHDPRFWRSPLRGPWLTSVLGLLLLGALAVVAASGFLSHAAYEPRLAGNAIVPPGRDLPFLDGGWPTAPAWLYALTQGLHVNVGLVAIPLLLAKLWSVIPRLFAWPPARSPAQAVERLGIALLVGSGLFEFATGVCNAQNWYPFGFNFVVAHYYGAIVLVASLAVHVAVKAPVVARALRRRGALAPLRASLDATRPEPADPDGLAPVRPAAPTLSRRGLLALAGAGSLTLLALNGGQSIGGPLRRLSLLAPRRASGFPVNKTAATAGIEPGMTGPGWRLALAGPGGERRLSREDLLGLEQRTETLPIACVEGWSTTQRWTGVRLADLAALAGGTGGGSLEVESLQRSGVLRRAALSAGQVADPRSLLALRVDGADLSPDHGYPARVIVPGAPGVHCTKWVSTLTFRA